jgi:hypothetical protein
VPCCAVACRQRWLHPRCTHCSGRNAVVRSAQCRVGEDLTSCSCCVLFCSLHLFLFAQADRNENG